MTECAECGAEAIENDFLCRECRGIDPPLKSHHAFLCGTVWAALEQMDNTQVKFIINEVGEFTNEMWILTSEGRYKVTVHPLEKN